MLDIKFVRSNPDIVKENIKKKFQNEKLPLVDEVLELDKRNREIKQEVEALRADKNKISKKIGACMAQGKKEEAEELKNQVEANAGRTAELSSEEKEVEEKIKEIMMVIPNIIDPSVPIGRDDSENVELERFGEPIVPDYEIPYHTEIMEKFHGIDLESAGKVAGNEVVQLYLHDEMSSVTTYVKVLRGFERIHLEPGEEKVIDFVLTPQELGLWNKDNHLSGSLLYTHNNQGLQSYPRYKVTRKI